MQLTSCGAISSPAPKARSSKRRMLVEAISFCVRASALATVLQSGDTDVPLRKRTSSRGSLCPDVKTGIASLDLAHLRQQPVNAMAICTLLLAVHKLVGFAHSGYGVV